MASGAGDGIGGPFFVLHEARTGTGIKWPTG